MSSRRLIRKFWQMKCLFFPFLRFSRSQLERRLAGKTVLITGASYGIGASLALSLAGTQCRLLLVARTAEKLIELKGRVEAVGGRADVFPCDLTNAAEVDKLLESIHGLGGVDVFVNNAGKSIRRSVFDALNRLHDFSRTMNLNYFGPVQLMLSLIPVLVERQGHVINVSAVNVLLVPAPKWAAYQASKTAFDQWFRCVGPELTERGVCMTSIYLPLVRTRMIEPTEAYKSLPAMLPEDVASLICKAIVSRRRTYAPWWMMPGQLASVLLRWPFEVMVGRRKSRL
ncbi:MAG: SDR family NAD(P)-dependent oxidoreductase [Planctomycetota bacterium]|nr:SDR family NAD(P)-dependent oxidoreductase [Planctomycetota bacterium]